MTSTTVSYLNVIGAVILFIISLWQVIVKTDTHGKKRIHTFGWVAVGAALFFCFISLWGVHESQIESENQRVTDSTRLVTTINKALAKQNLSYNPYTQLVSYVNEQHTNINSPKVTGFSADNSNGSVMLGNQVIYNNIDENLEARLMDAITTFAFQNGIKDKGVYLFWDSYSKAGMDVETATKILNRYGYYVVETNEKRAVIPKNWNPNNIHFMIWKGKVAAIVSRRR